MEPSRVWKRLRDTRREQFDDRSQRGLIDDSPLELEMVNEAKF